MKTPEELATFAYQHQPDGADGEVRAWLAVASARNILQFQFAMLLGIRNRHFPEVRSALDVRLAEDATIAAETLQRQIVELTRVAEAQRVLSVRIERLTWALLVLTFGLFLFTIYLSYDAYLKSKSSDAAKPHASQQTEFYRVYAA